MRKFNEDNERIKRKFLGFLKHAKGQDEKSLDKAVAAILKFEESTKFKSFKLFHIEQAGKFKVFLEKAKHPKTGKPHSLSTIDSTLRLVKAFFHWLASQPGYKSRINYPDVEYFNNNSKNARAAHAQRHIPYPSMEQAFHAFQAMPNGGELERRDRALFAFFMLTAARDGAVASLRLKHINLFDGYVFQDGQNVKTKNSKTIDTWFFPVNEEYRECFDEWVQYLRVEKFYGPEDALFPKPKIELVDGRFSVVGLSHTNYATAGKLVKIIRKAFAAVQMFEFTPHSFRKTLAKFGDEKCISLTEMKAWSMNMGHENLVTTISAYMPVSRDRQADLIKRMRESSNGQSH